MITRSVASRTDAAPPLRSQPRLRDTFDEPELSRVVRLLERMLHDGVVVQDAAGAVVYANTKAAELMRLQPAQLRGVRTMDHAWGAVRLDGSLIPEPEHPALRAIKEGRSSRGELLGIRVAGLPDRWLSVDSSPIDLRSGRHAVSVITDVTESIDDHRALQTVHDEIEQQLVQRLMPTGEWFRCVSDYRPAGVSKSIGGDFLGVDLLEARRLGLFVGDVCGHGVGAAGLSSIARNSTKALGRVLDGPARVLSELHDIVTDERPDMFVTMVYASIDASPDRTALRLACGGHPPPMLVRDGRVQSVGETGRLIGMVPNHDRPEVEVPLRSGDHLYFITDGVLDGGEQRLSPQELMSAMPLSAVLDDTVAWLSDQSGPMVVDRSSRRPDDATVLGIEIL